jgi:hypothetical protein
LHPAQTVLKKGAKGFIEFIEHAWTGQGHAEGSNMDPRGHFQAGNSRLKLTCFLTFNFCSNFVFTYPSSTAFLYMEKAKIACKIELEKQLSERW